MEKLLKQMMKIKRKIDRWINEKPADGSMKNLLIQWKLRRKTNQGYCFFLVFWVEQLSSRPHFCLAWRSNYYESGPSEVARSASALRSHYGLKVSEEKLVGIKCSSVFSIVELPMQASRRSIPEK